MTARTPGLLGPAGPAQHELLIHFCGRANTANTTPSVPPSIRKLEPWQRLDRILWEGQIRGFAPFGSDRPMVCLSESPPEHLRWLLANHRWQPWGVFLRRQAVYDLGGGPAWYVRSKQLEALPTELRGWAVRFETGPNRSDWLHEREWRIPVPTDNPVLPLSPGSVSAILIADPQWQPTRLFPRTVFVDEFGRQVPPGRPGYPKSIGVPRQPALWTSATRLFWDATQQQILKISHQT